MSTTVGPSTKIIKSSKADSNDIEFRGRNHKIFDEYSSDRDNIDN
jgi:hypothetical protein